MQYETVAALIDQIETLDVADLTADLAARLNEVVQRRQRTIAQSVEIYGTFVAELELAGYDLSPDSYAQPDYVFVASSELIAWKPLFSDELVDQRMAMITARLTEGRWQVTRMFHDTMY